MEPLAAAKMKATTTVTLFIIIFLIAVGWSTVEVDAAEASAGQTDGSDLVDEIDQSMKRLNRKLDWDWVDQQKKKKQKEEEEQCFGCALGILEKPSRKMRRRLKRFYNQLVPERYYRLEYEYDDDDDEYDDDDDEDNNSCVSCMLDKPRKMGRFLKRFFHKVHKVQEVHKEEEEEDGFSFGMLDKPPRQMGDIWITVGLSTVFLFFMVLTLRVFRKLEEQRKSRRKTHAFPIDDLGGITNLLG